MLYCSVYMRQILVLLLVIFISNAGSSVGATSFFKNLFGSRQGQRERPGFWYQVETGDTLYSLSKAYKVSISDLKKANKLDDDRLPLKKIWIPRSTYDPSKSDLPHPHPRQALQRVEKAKISKPKKIETNSATELAQDNKEMPQDPKKTKFQWPVPEPVMNRLGLFGAKPAETRNSGILIEVAENTPVHPAREGKTVFKGHLKGYGNTVILDHLDNYFTVYAHLGKISKLNEGTSIKTDQVLGYTGLSGTAHKPVLHFEVRHLNEPLDPLRFLDPEKITFSDKVDPKPKTKEDS